MYLSAGIAKNSFDEKHEGHMINNIKKIIDLQSTCVWHPSILPLSRDEKIASTPHYPKYFLLTERVTFITDYSLFKNTTVLLDAPKSVHLPSLYFTY